MEFEIVKRNSLDLKIEFKLCMSLRLVPINNRGGEAKTAR